jgi:integrase
MISLARRVYYLGMDDQMLKYNPFAKRGLYKEEAKGKYIPEDQFWSIYGSLTGSSEYLKPVVLLAYLTGMRKGEIIDLVWDRVILSEGYINLSAADTKTNNPRHIYFNSLQALKDLFIEADKKRKPGQKLVFTKPDGEIIPRKYTNRLFNKACSKAGVGPYRMHDLRHTFNTNMSKAGVDQNVTMKLTGHKTFAMFLRYDHVDQERSESAMDKLGGFLKLKN